MTITRCLSSLMIFIVFGCLVQAEDLAIIGLKGEVYLWASVKGAIIWDDDVLEGRDFWEDAYFDQSSSTLFVTSAREYCTIFLSQTPPEKSIVDTGGKHRFSVFFDVDRQKPAWVPHTDKISSLVVSQDQNGTIIPVPEEDIFFSRISISPLYIPGSQKTTQDFLRKHPETWTVFETFSDAKWILSGRSKTLTVYERILLEITKEGAPFQATLLFYDHTRDAWNVFTLEEYGNAYVYDQVAVIQEIHTIKGDSIQGPPTGTWYFYFPGSDRLVSSSLAPDMTILYATADTAYLVKGQDVYKAALSMQGLSEPELLLTMPDTVEIFRVYPIDLPQTSSQEQPSQQVGTYLLASTQERSELPMPCTLYRTDAASQTLSAPLATIFPHRGIHQVTAHPLYRKLAVWREDDHQTGSLVIVDVDLPAYRQTVSLSFAPTSGGAFLVHEDTPLVLSRAVSARHAEAYTAPLGADRADRSLTHLQWNTALLQGANVLRGRRLRSVVVQFEPHTNQLFPFFYDDGDAILPFQFDEVTRQRFESFHTNVADMPGNTARLCVLRPYIQNQLPEKFPLLVYDKLTRTWREVAVDNAAFAVQVFGPWIVMQHVMPNQDDPDGLPTPTGDYTFTHLDRETPMHWQADDQTEVLGIWGATLLYRTGETVFEATIDEHDIIDSRPVCRDPAVQHVHWAFRLPSQGGEE